MTIDGLTFFAQWDSNGGHIDENSVQLSNVVYETISKVELKDLNLELIPSSLKYKFIIQMLEESAHYFELSPIIKDRGFIKK